MIIMTSVVYSKIIGIVEKQSTENSIHMLSQVRDMLDMKLLEFEQIALQITKNPLLTPYNVSNTGYKSYQTVRELENYIKGNLIIRDICLYVRESDMIYTSGGIFTLDEFVSSVYNYENWSKDSFTDYINSINISAVRPSEFTYVNNRYNKMKIITYVYPVPRYSPYATLLFIIEENSIYNMIKNIMKEIDASTIITDEKGNIISSSNSILIENNLKEKLAGILENENSEGVYVDVKIDNSDYMMSYVKSGFNAWSYVTFIPKDRMLDRINNIKNVTLIAIILISFVGIILIYVMMLMNYLPIRLLRKSIEALLPLNNEEDDVRTISTAMKNVVSNNSILEDRINKHKNYLKPQVLLKIIGRQIGNIEELRLVIKDTGLIFDKPFYGVVMIYRDGSENIPSDSILNSIENYTNEDIGLYAVTMPDNNYIALIVNLTEDMKARYVEELSALLNAMRVELSSRYKIRLTFGVGHLYDDMFYVSRSYIEACSAIDYRLLKGYGKVILFSELEQFDGEQLWYPVEDMERLIVCIKQGDIENIQKILAQVSRIISNDRIPLYMVRCYCFDIINSIIKAIFELNIKFEDLGGERPDLMILTKFQTVSELIDMIDSLCLSVCSYIGGTRESGNTALKTDMINYIEKNFTDQNLGTKLLASEFNLSQSYLSRYFKNQTGYSIIDYVTRLRIKEIKYLLETTEKPIKDVIQDVGYIDIPNFNRKFKELEGMSPGEYRKLTARA